MKFKNWKTTSAGILLIIGGVTRLVFAIVHKQFTEESVTTTSTAILTGLGMLLAKDFDVTGTPNHEN